MKKTEFFAPQIDIIIEGASPGNNHASHGTFLKLKNIYKAFSCIKAEAVDEVRHTWLEVDRGSFTLSDADEIVRMVNGNDFIGIVPDTVFPRYCHSLFPKEDNIIDFMNLGFDIEINEKLVQKIYWYPLEEIILEDAVND